jgi:hypothetical protein
MDGAARLHVEQAKTGNMARERRMSEGSYEAAVRAGLIDRA